ncbi:DEAD/DEAH box helicase [Nocardioides ultimimeridianus]
MKFTLKDYQEDAVGDLLEQLERAQVEWHREGTISSTALTATTGAGKTVMAAAVIEALFWGNEQFGYEPDPDHNAVVLWFSDDPSLNLQTRDRLLEASEKFTSADLVVIEPPFAKAKLEPGKVYLLNTQRLGKNSLLTRGHVADPDEEQLVGMEATPDMQGWTIWETIANTIADDDLTLYLVLDEAHRGFNKAKGAGEKPTLVKRLVNGHAGYPPVPIVLGISATIERYKDAMKAASDTRRQLPSVNVDPGRVQESGLVKDTIALNIPDEAGQFDLTLVELGAERLKQSRERWATYARKQNDVEVVQPLLILQTPNTPDPDEIGHALDAIAKVLPDVTERNVRHVFGDHTLQKFGAWEVDWIEPQRVEEDKRVTILVAKDAISTGWDCPRAEVMVSFRPAKDNTHITQLLGRMVRSPLARRVPGDERLNAVDCILPNFDRTTAGNVVKFLTGQIDEMPGKRVGPKVLVDGKELLPNPQVSEAVWDLWDRLPTQTMPQKGARPVKRLVALAQALAADGVRPGALKQVEAEICSLLDTYAGQYAGALDQAVQEIWDVHVQEILGKVGGTKLSYQQFVVRADDRAIRTGFRFAKAAFGADVAMAYVDHLAPDDDDDDFLRDAFVKTSALAAMPEVRHKVDLEANRIVDAWYAEHGPAIATLSDERQQEYDLIRALAVDPQVVSLKRPRSRMEDYSFVDEAGKITPSPLVAGHLMSDASGMFPVGNLNPWERKVVEVEMARPGALAWYRNPPRAATDSLTIAYRDVSGNWRSMHPDFVFFHEFDGKVAASIVDPHGHHLDDAALKLRALASFAEACGDGFHRIEAVSVLNGKYLFIDAQDETSRADMLRGDVPAQELFESDIAIAYVGPRL